MQTDNSKEELEKEKLNLEKEKLINEIALQKIEIEHKSYFKGWRKKIIRFFEPVKEWGQTIATLFLGVVGIIFTVNNNSNQVKSNKVMMATQLMSEREKSETDFRQNIFPSLIQQILNDSLPLKKRMNVFELFENNFNDLFNSRSFYDVLWDTATKAQDSTAMKKRLIDLARYTSAKQESQINELEDRKTLCFSPGLNTIDYTFADKDEGGGKEHVVLTLDSILENYIVVNMIIDCNDLHKKPRPIIKINNGNQFHVSYFDTPLSTNFLMPDGDRIAVILEEIDRKHKSDSARLDIVHFPGDYITVGYRPSTQKVNNLVDKKD